MPRDQVTARDGQVFIFEPEMAMITGTKPARGWIVELAARPAGLFGRVDWLDDAVRAGPSANLGQSSFDRAEHLGQCPYRHAEFERLRRLESRPAILHPDPVGRTDRPRHSPQRRRPGKLRPPSKAGCLRPRGGNRQRRAAWPRGAGVDAQARAPAHAGHALRAAEASVADAPPIPRTDQPRQAAGGIVVPFGRCEPGLATAHSRGRF